MSSDEILHVFKQLLWLWQSSLTDITTGLFTAGWLDDFIIIIG